MKLHLLHRVLLEVFGSIAVCLIALLVFTQLGAAQVAEEDDETYAKDASTEINVKNADIAAIVRIFSKKTKRNYILDERVKGKVSIYLPGKVSSGEAIRILDSVLALKGFTAVPIGKNLWKIIPAREAKQTTIPTISETAGRGSPSVVTRLINLKYVTADDVKQLLAPLISTNGLLNAYTGTNSLILIDSEENIQRLAKIVESLDIPFSDRDMVIIPVKHAEATDLATKINDILSEEGEKGKPADQNLDFVRARLRESVTKRSPSSADKTSAGGQANTITVSARSRAPKIIADERTNAIIVVADEDTIARIRALVSQLDSQVDLSGTKFYVYRCQHASAEELAEVLSGLAGNGGSSSTGSTTRRQGAGTSPLERQRNTGSRDRGERVSRTQDRLSNQRRTPGRSRSEESSGKKGVSSVQFSEDLSITADPATNSLVIIATRADYEKILDLVKQLDIKRRQVLVEAMVLEVKIEDNIQVGTEWITSGGGADGGVIAVNNFGNLSDLFTNPTALSQLTVAAASSGSLTLPGGVVIPSQTVMMRAAGEATNVNVLSSPTILATDNEEAEIVVGENVPFLASTASSQENLNNTFNQIDRQDVGITLRLTPQISGKDFVTLHIFTEVSSVILATLGSDLGPTTTIRTSETTVIAKDAQMVVTGGLIADNITESEIGVPFLRDVPILGHMFKEKTVNGEKTNLLIFLTPRIIKDQFDIRDETVEFRDTMREFMDYRDVEPPRDNVLQDRDIDAVTENVRYEGKKPGTIFPSKKAKSPRRASLRPEKPEDSSISVKVSPRLPEKEDFIEPAASKNEDSKTSAAGSRVRVSHSASTGGSGSKFIILQAANAADAPASLPFTLSGGSSLLGLIIPAESQRSAKSFFKVGWKYRYAIEDSAVDFNVVGIFPDAAEAAVIHPDLNSNWHTLSPFEIMNIGSAPWIKNKGRTTALMLFMI